MKAVVIVLFTALICRAADQAWFRIIGFSPDGGYLAWETGGIQDGSGFPWIRMVVLDSRTSIEADSRYRVWEDETAAPDVDYLRRERADLMMEFGIEEGNTGEPLVYYPVTDLSAPGDSVLFCLDYYCPGYNAGEYLLRLKGRAVSAEEGYPDWFPDPVLLSMTAEGDSAQIFFSEDEAPEDYAYVFGYSIAAVYRNPALSRSVAVVLHAVVPGFEGADGRFRVVSGELP